MFSFPLLNVLSAFVIAALITWFSIPSIIKVVIIKKLSDRPGNRKIHKHDIPTMGGIGIFGGLFISLMLFVNGYVQHLSIITASGLMVFFMGQKDDLVSMPPYKKLLVEFFAALLIAGATNLRFTSFHGLFGINAIPVWLSIAVTVFVIILIMNSFNLIDGIDGLAASIGILCAIIFGTWFWIAGDIGFTVMAAAIAGALCAFLPFNVYNGRFKIFMGDTGSLTIGLLLAILTIRFNELNAIETTPLRFHSAPAVTLGILILPVFDLIRVSLIRLSQKTSPFHADNNHLHHLLLRLGLTHFQTTLFLVIISTLFTILAVSLDSHGATAVFLILLTAATILSIFVSKLERRFALNKEIEEEVTKILESSYKKTG